TKMEIMLQQKMIDDVINHQTQVEIPVTIADFYFPTAPRPTLAFVDGPPHRRISQSVKDEEVRSLLRKKGYKVLELEYSHYSDKIRNQLYEMILAAVRR